MSTTASADNPRTHSERPQPAQDFWRADERLVRLNLGDVPMPRVGGLEVEGFKPSWLQRLFGRR